MKFKKVKCGETLTMGRYYVLFRYRFGSGKLIWTITCSIEALSNRKWDIMHNNRKRLIVNKWKTLKFYNSWCTDVE